MKNEIKLILFVNEKFVRNRFRDDYFKNFHPLLFNRINNDITFEGYSFKEKLYIYYFGINKPICKICGKKTSLISFNKGFHTYCSKKCVQKDDAIIKKKIKSNIINFGVEYPQKSNAIKEKTRKTNLRKYGVESVFQVFDVQKKIKETNLKKYGTENPFGSLTLREKIRKTNIKNYGVEHNSQSNLVIEKRKKRFIELYGVDNPNKCADIIKKRNCTITLNYIKKYAKILNINICDIETMSNDVVKISNYCKKHASFKIDKQNLLNRCHYGIENLCTKCNPIAKMPTIKENEIIDFIKSLNINHIRKERKFLKGKEIDIYLPDHKLGIEFDGLYWHSDLYKDKNYHVNKTEECEKRGIQLLHVFEDEWINKKEIVKSIIKSKLGLVDNKIFARKCKIREINDNKLIKDFLLNNHIQGNVNAKIKIGLFHENELVSLMTFGKKRIALGNKGKSVDNEYEMLRFCNKLNTVVIGGASKLLAYFIKTYHPNTIITFADRRYSQGDLYVKLGFDFIENTKPNYWYFKKSRLIRLHRFNFRKNVLVKKYNQDSNKSEAEIMRNLEYYKIYDCGNMKFGI